METDLAAKEAKAEAEAGGPNLIQSEQDRR
jgi:hypothetical protein